MKMWSAGHGEGAASSIQGREHSGREVSVAEGWIRLEDES
jgi:hypothetical protein